MINGFKPGSKRWLLIVLLFTLTLSSCGFHLRGMRDMPRWLDRVTIVVENANRDLEPLLSDQLRAYRIQVCSDPASANYWLIIEQDSVRQQITSISSSTTPRQYQLTYTVQFKLTRAKGNEIIPTTPIVVTRLLTVNSDRILGSNDEEAILKREMRRDAVMQILDRIGAHHAD